MKTPARTIYKRSFFWSLFFLPSFCESSDISLCHLWTTTVSSLGSPDILQGNCWGEHAFRMINPLAFQRSVLLGLQPLPRKDTLWPPASGNEGTASKLKVSLDLMPRGKHKINYAVWLGKVDFYVQPNLRNKLWSGQLALFISFLPPQS